MNSVLETTGHYISEYETLQHQMPGNKLSWLQSLRQTALEEFSRLGFPDQRHEDWKYTNIKPIVKQQFLQVFKACKGLSLDDLGPGALEELDCHRLVFINGLYARLLSSPGNLEAGINILPMTAALDEDFPQLKQHLTQHAKIENGFTAINQSNFSDGYYIHLEKNTELKKPIHVIFAATVTKQPQWHHLRNLIILGENSQAQVIESFLPVGEDAVYLQNIVSECVLEQNAKLDHYCVQEEGLSAFHIAKLSVSQSANSSFNSHALSFGSKLARNQIDIHLNDKGADCELNGLYLANGRQHVDYHTRVDHYKEHGSSRENYKGILDGHARAVFNGQVYVHPQAQKTDAQQSNKNLLLSANAEIDTKPQLEIYADDVKCSHGATVGQLDDNMLFYLQSRGINETQARAMLTYGFARDIIDRITIEPIRSRVSRLLLEHLPYTETLSDIS